MKYNYQKTKSKNIIRRLRELNYLPQYGLPMNENQTTIYNQIKNGDFQFWENIKSQNNWSNQKKSDDDHKLSKKRQNIRYILKSKGIIPKDNSIMNEEHIKILQQIENNDFSFYDSLLKNFFNIDIFFDIYL